MVTRSHPALFNIPSTATLPGPASGALRSHRTGEYISGAPGRETPDLQDLKTSRYERIVNQAG